jgi:hypothetical protein
LATDGQTKIGGRRSGGAITTAYPAYNDVFTE